MGLDMITAAIDRVNWTAAMQVAVVAGVILTVFRMQTAEQLETIVGCDSHHGVWGILRRLSHSLMMLAMLWFASYGYEKGWQPWPPTVALLFAIDFSMFVSIMIMRQDIAETQQGHREIVWSAGRSPPG